MGDRDQTRRDAERIPDDELARIRNYLAQWSYTVGTETPEGVPLAKQLLRHSDALLSELEQAEEDKWPRLDHWRDRAKVAEARLAKVQADLEHCSVGWATDTAKLRDANERLARVSALVEAGTEFWTNVRFFTDGPGDLALLIDAADKYEATLTVWEQE